MRQLWPSAGKISIQLEDEYYKMGKKKYEKFMIIFAFNPDFSKIYKFFWILALFQFM